MFGYSISLGQTSSLSYMAVGKPWDATVHVYSIRNPDHQAIVTNISTLGQPPTGPQLKEQFKTTQWTAVTMLRDTNNGTYPNRMISLFGYSISFSDQAQWLAVGIPARTYQSTNTVQLQFSPYNGAVRLYRRLSATQFTYFGEIPNPNADRFWDRFGSKVQLKRTQSALWLFVAANSGWDGASTKYYDAELDTDGWPIQPTTDTSRAGVYVYEVLNPSRTDVPQQANQLAVLRQFVPTLSKVPLGSLGIDFDALVGADDAVTLLMRDYVLPEGVSEHDYTAACPNRTCSYLVLKQNGQTVTLNSTGAVVEYRLNTQTRLFEATKQQLKSVDFPKELISIETDLQNAGYQRDDWERNDWFGVGISAALDQKYNRILSMAGAPRDASGVFSFYKPSSGGTWSQGQFIPNTDIWRRSFFGQKVQLSPDARFLLVADPSGTSESMGRGIAYLYHRRSDSELMYPPELNQVPRQPLVSNSVPYQFDYMGSFSKLQQVGSANWTRYEADHFGHGIAVNQYFAVMGAPVEQCVYTYLMPLSVDLPPQPEPTGPGNYTITPPPPEPTESSVETQSKRSEQTWVYILIAGLCAFLLVIPVAMYLMKRRHRMQTLSQLKQHQQAQQSGDVQGSAEGLNGTRDDLSPGHVRPDAVLASSDTLASSTSM